MFGPPVGWVSCMSVRTKLLAAVIGLPVAVLLLCLYLLLRAEDQEYANSEALAGIVSKSQVASAHAFGRHLLEAMDQGVFEEVYLMRFAYPWTDESEDDFWTARVYFDESTGRDTVPDLAAPRWESLRGRIARRVAALRDIPGAWRTWEVEGNELAILPDRQTRNRDYGVLAVLRTRRSVARQIYAIMIGGSLLMALLGWWLVGTLVVDPVERLAASADALAQGKEHEPLDAGPGSDEVARTVRAFNRMAQEIRTHRHDLEARVVEGLDRIERTEQHLIVAQRLTATGKLAAGLAHEINNPLGGMKNALQALQRGDVPEARVPVYLELLEDGLSRVEDLVQRFLMFTPRSPAASPTDIEQVAERALALADHALRSAGVVVIRSWTQADATPPAKVFGDAAELQQVLLNIFLNAADALTDLEAHVGRKPQLDVSLGEVGDEVIVRIEDNGPGMTPDTQAECFDMFFTTKDVGEGSGLGLAVAHTIVSNHGGSIELRSEVGAGTTFLIYLPKTQL